MNMPGFTAEASLNTSTSMYRGSRMDGITVQTQAEVVPQIRRLLGCFSIGEISSGGVCVCGVEDSSFTTAEHRAHAAKPAQP